MKCGSCGAIGSSASSQCDFCGNRLGATQVSGSGESSGGNANELNPNAFVGYVKDSLAMVQDLNKSPSKGFNWWAFFFPVPFLWGYGASDNAKSVATVLLVPAAAVWLLSRLFWNWDILDLAWFAWAVYVSFMVATRVDVLAKRDKTFDVGGAIVAGLVYSILISLFV